MRRGGPSWWRMPTRLKSSRRPGVGERVVVVVVSACVLHSEAFGSERTALAGRKAVVAPLGGPRQGIPANDSSPLLARVLHRIFPDCVAVAGAGAVAVTICSDGARPPNHCPAWALLHPTRSVASLNDSNATRARHWIECFKVRRISTCAPVDGQASSRRLAGTRQACRSEASVAAAPAHGR